MTNWDELQTLAQDALKNAYAPYSNYPVGAAGLTEDGRLVSGCNVENASTGLGLCAECGLVSDLARGGGGRLCAVVAVNGSGNPVPPCGRCRQLLYEHGGPELEILLDGGAIRLGELLPHAFGPDSLEDYAHRS